MKSIFLTTILLSNIYANTSQMEYSYLDDLSLEELMNIKIYSASKSYQKIEEIPANITVLTRKDIEKYNYINLQELLRNIPGLFIIDDTEHFQIGSMGSVGSSFKLMINNNAVSPQRIPTGGMSNRNFFATPIQSIDRIEIIKGPQSVTYGNNSMYGSINIITNDFNSKNMISIGKGNNKQNKLFVRLNKKLENGGFTLNTSFYNTNGINGDLKDTFTIEDYNKYPNAARKVDSLLKNESKTLDFSYTYKNLTSDITISQTNYGLFLYEQVYRDGIQVKQTEKSFALTYEDEINEKLFYKINYIHSKKDYIIEDIAILPQITHPSNNYVTDDRDQLDVHFNYKYNKYFKFLLGLTYEQINEKVKTSSEKIKAKQEYQYEITQEDIYTKLFFNFNNNIEFNTGVRFLQRSDFKIDSKAILFSDNSTYSIIMPYKKINETLFEHGIIYNLNKNNFFKLLYGNSNQLVYNSIEDYEEITSTSLNYIHLAKNYKTKVTIFNNLTKGINLFSQSNTTSANVESSEINSKGIEIVLSYKKNDIFKSDFSFVIQKSSYLGTNNNIEPGFSPKILSSLNITYLNKQIRYSLLVNYIGEMKSSIKDYSTLDRLGEDTKENINISTNVNYKYNKNLSIDFHLINILNKDNRTPASSTLTKFNKGMFSNSRSGMISLNYKF